MKTVNRAAARTCAAVALLVTGLATPGAQAQTPTPPDSPKFDIYGFAQADAIFDTGQVDPNWQDAARPTKLPSFANQFGENGRTSLSVKQSRFGVKADLPTPNGNVKAVFEFDMFGVGPDAGKTTIRLRHAWGQWKQIGGGQTNSPFMDVEVFPNILDYWGPNGMLFFRNVQVFWRPIEDEHTRVTLAIERPGASADAGDYASRIEIQNIKPRFPAPDFSGEYRAQRQWGYVKIGGMLRKMAWDDLLPDKYHLAGSVIGGGVSVSTGLKVSPKDLLHLQYVYGHGIQNYFNDAPVDVGIVPNPGNTLTPVTGEALPITGFVGFLDHTWNDQWATSAGYSLVHISNSSGQAPSAYKHGDYVVVSLINTPAKNVMMGGEVQWIRRENFSDGFSVDDIRIQFSFKYSFGISVGGK